MKSAFFSVIGVVMLMGMSGCGPEKEVVSEPKIPQATESAVAPEPAAPEPVTTRPAPTAQRPDKEKPATQDEAPSGPRISFEKTEYDYGVVAPRSTTTGKFPFSNTGDETLHIENFRYPCGCSVPELPKRDYEPGESGVIDVRYSAPARASVDVYPIYVYSNDPETPRFELTIKARVEVNVEVEPKDVSLLLDQENAAMPALTVRSTDGQAFAITRATSTDNVITLPFDRNEQGTEFVLQPEVDMDRLEVTPSGQIQIHTNHPNSGVLSVRFNATPLFEISHPRLILQNIVPGQEVIRDVWIRSNYDQKVEIESYTSTNEMMSIDSQRQDGNHLQIMVKITPPADAPTANRRYISDELMITLTSGQELSIRCSGWYRIN